MSQEFQSWMTRFSPALGLALIACSLVHAQDVRSNYIPGTDFSKYHNYSWVIIGGIGHPDQILDTEIKRSIDSELVGKGFTKVDSGTPGSAHTADFPKPLDLPNRLDLPQPPDLPQMSAGPPQRPDLPRTADSANNANSAHPADLLVDYQIGIQQERQWNAFGMRDALGGGMSTATATATSSTINNGILVVSIYDGATRGLIWRGFAVKEINLNKDQQKNRKNLDKATQKLLKDFPPRRT
ncbi:MAG: DUF4136 domain-containing protein [Acidobacteriaceae bacterium]|nr:DUF4136 domain-containing protein [Acidobacteriaceae bacterium]